MHPSISARMTPTAEGTAQFMDIPSSDSPEQTMGPVSETLVDDNPYPAEQDPNVRRPWPIPELTDEDEDSLDAESAGNNSWFYGARLCLQLD
jgi:hypothetical protein